MGGLGKRFTDGGYDRPKPLIEFLGKTMIEHVVENLGYTNKFTICLQRPIYHEYKTVFDSIQENIEVDYVLMNGLSEGPASTCLQAREFINNNDMLLIANCDQLMSWDQDHFVNWYKHNRLQGAIFTFFNDTTKCSYAQVDENNLVTRTAEKQVISTYATTGIYVWDRGKDFVESAESMIQKGLKTNNEYFVAPAYNEFIHKGFRVGIYDKIEHYPIGVPEDLENFIKMRNADGN
jgi:UDP-N-acetylglucosamine diphosphorylase / glucose-1-phosphate thymidylyltransferase / UDP-N-acetylgalactosamine diphosphorylase / glucosamine-1-phosphate N-acetyltransferase / galactosamine-1-phosphate N-acetyltransferase